MQVCEDVGSACVAVDHNPTDGHCTLSGTGLTEADVKGLPCLGQGECERVADAGWIRWPADGGTTDSTMQGADGGVTPTEDGKACYAKVCLRRSPINMSGESGARRWVLT